MRRWISLALCLCVVFLAGARGSLTPLPHGSVAGSLGEQTGGAVGCTEVLWYVDSAAPAGGDGCSWATAYQSVDALVAARGVDAVGDGSFNGGDTVRARGSLPNLRMNGQGGGWPNNVTLTGADGLTLTGASQLTVGNGVYTIVTDRANGLTLTGITIAHVAGARHIALFQDPTGLDFHSWTFSGQAGNGGAGDDPRLIWLKEESTLNSSNVRVRNFNIDVQITGGPNDQYYDIIECTDTTAAAGRFDDCTIEGGVITDRNGPRVTHGAIVLTGTQGSRIENNIVQVNGRGIALVAQTDGTTIGPEGTVVQGNQIERNATAQAQCMVDQGRSNLFRRNTCWTTAPPAAVPDAVKSGIRAQQDSGTRLNQAFESTWVHNTFYRLDDAPSYSPLAFRAFNQNTLGPILNEATMRVDIRNNIVVDFFSDPLTNQIGCWSNGPDVPCVVAGNTLAVNPSGTPGLCKGNCAAGSGRDDGDIQTMQATQTASWFAFGNTDATGQPLFNDPDAGDFNLPVDSAAVDRGVELAKFTGGVPCAGVICTIDYVNAFRAGDEVQTEGGALLTVDSITPPNTIVFTTTPSPLPIDGELLAYRWNGNAPDPGARESPHTGTTGCYHDLSQHDLCTHL